VIFEPKAVVCHLAEERPDIPRSETNMRSEFYVWRNTVWLYVKHFGWKPKTILQVAFMKPLITCFRRVFGGSLRAPKINSESLRFLPAACAGIAGGIWGVVMSFLYEIQDGLMRQRFSVEKSASKWPRLGRGRSNVLGDVQWGVS
jgi:hypothetical protein